MGSQAEDRARRLAPWRGGAGTVLATKGREVSYHTGTVVTVLVQKPLTVRVQIEKQQ